MEGATLNIKFTDETAGGKGPAATPISGSQDPISGSQEQTDSNVQSTQNAITQAGGVGNYVTKTGTQPPPLQPIPSPTVYQVPASSTASVPSPGTATTTASSDPLLNTVSGIVKADPKVTAEEIAKALGIHLGQAQNLYNQAVGAPSVPSNGSPNVPSPSSTTPPPPPSGPTPPPVPPPVAAVTPPPPPPTPPPVQGQPPTPPPLPVPPANPLSPNTANGVQQTVGAIASLARQGGPIAGAVAGVGQAASNLPGVAGAIGAALPGLAMAAPYVALAGAALAVPAAAVYTLDRIADTARGQIQGLDPRVAQAEAEASVRQIMANFRTSRRLGDEVAAGIEIESRRSAALQGLRDSFSEVPLQKLNNTMEGLNSVLEGLDKFFGEGFGNAAAQAGSSNLYDFVTSNLGVLGLVLKGLELRGTLEDTPSKPKDPVLPWANRELPTLPYPFNEGPIKLDRSLSEHGRPGF